MNKCATKEPGSCPRRQPGREKPLEWRGGRRDPAAANRRCLACARLHKSRWPSGLDAPTGPCGPGATTVPGFREAAEPRTDETADDPGLPEATLRELAASAKSEHVRLRAASSSRTARAAGDAWRKRVRRDGAGLQLPARKLPEAVVSVYALKLAEAIRACDDAGIEQPYLSALREALASMDCL